MWGRRLLRAIILIFLLALVGDGSAAFLEKDVVCPANSSLAIFSNPAGLGELGSLNFSALGGKIFGLSELSYNLTALSCPQKRGAVGLGFESFGEGIYQERTFIFSFAARFEDLTLGVNLKQLYLDIETVGSLSSFGLDLGLLYLANNRMKLNLLGRNLNRPYLGEKLPQEFRFGFDLQPLEDLTLSLGLDKSSQLRIGAKIKISPHLFIRGSVNQEPSTFTGGLTFRLKRGELDYTYLSHSVLGPTHLFGITWKIENGNN